MRQHLRVQHPISELQRESVCVWACLVFSEGVSRVATICVGCFPHPQDTPHSQRQRDSETETCSLSFFRCRCSSIRFRSLVPLFPRFLVSLFPCLLQMGRSICDEKLLLRSICLGGREGQIAQNERDTVYSLLAVTSSSFPLCPHAHKCVCCNNNNHLAAPHCSAANTHTITHTHSLTVHFEFPSKDFFFFRIRFVPFF